MQVNFFNSLLLYYYFINLICSSLGFQHWFSIIFHFQMHKETSWMNEQENSFYKNYKGKQLYLDNI